MLYGNNIMFNEHERKRNRKEGEREREIMGGSMIRIERDKERKIERDKWSERKKRDRVRLLRVLKLCIWFGQINTKLTQNQT